MSKVARKQRLREVEHRLGRELLWKFVEIMLVAKGRRAADPQGWPAFCHRHFSESSEQIDTYIGFAEQIIEDLAL